MFAQRFILRAACLVGLAVLLPAGCVITVEPTDGGEGGDGGGTTEKITVRIFNNTNTDLDPEIYISAEPITKDELFHKSNKFTEFGVFDAGVLGPRGIETFEIDCAQTRVIGTAGGRFESETNPEQSDREIVLAQDLVFLCGDRITFIYSRTVGGFTTRFELD